ncbi:hypothetical protein HMPREF0063_10119 [Aeromicrobium marinum DSM 15272]|uniref:YtxH domain-containing protein n=1 Tax=Aeromicrobium marinum DSM 15272 TaxID=585531 RepID=E2S7W2_9ACTN|nr:hypothetical protein [Aeromicrobium marinum]EFQ84778.1 hypothetical protein HMPREF0063_10119 [Aeromicrobium marinum DSM 15272]
MFRKTLLLAAGGAGYVLGARAGRERYEQIMSRVEGLRNDPTVQQAAQDARSAASDVVDDLKESAQQAGAEVTGRSDDTDGARSAEPAPAKGVPGGATGV